MDVVKNIQDSELISQVRKGGIAGDRATEVMYRKYRNEVLRKVKGMIRYRRGQTADARDLVQDAYIILIDKVCSPDYEEGSVRNFWIGIVNGLLRNKLKRDYRMTLVEDHSAFDREDLATPAVKLEDKERFEMLEHLLEQVGEKCKHIMKLAMKGYSMKEIASQMELASEGMARKTKYQCKKRLVELIQKRQLDL